MAFSPNGITHRSTVTGRRGMVASAHPLASVAGLRILMEALAQLTDTSDYEVVQAVEEVARRSLHDGCPRFEFLEDWSLPISPAYLAEAKRQTLLEIVEYVNNTRSCFNESLMQDLGER